MHPKLKAVMRYLETPIAFGTNTERLEFLGWRYKLMMELLTTAYSRLTDQQAVELAEDMVSLGLLPTMGPTSNEQAEAPITQKLVRVSRWYNSSIVSKYTLYKWSHVNRFPGLFVKVGGALYVDTYRLQQILEEGRSK